MRVLFAGGTGFVGRTFLEHLSECQFSSSLNLTLVSRNPEAFISGNGSLLNHSDAQLNVVRGELPDVAFHDKFDVIVHGAEIPFTVGIGKEELIEKNRRVLHALLQITERSEAGRFVYLSSGAVYSVDNRLSPPFDVQSELKINADEASAYALSKFHNENELRRLAKEMGIDHAVIRIFNVASRHVPLGGRYALGQFMADALDHQTQEVCIKSSGGDQRSFIAGRQLAALIAHCIEEEGGGRIYNACSEHRLTIDEIANLVVRAAGVLKPIAIENPDARVNNYTGIPNLADAFLSGPDDIFDAIVQLANAHKQSK